MSPAARAPARDLLAADQPRVWPAATNGVAKHVVHERPATLRRIRSRRPAAAGSPPGTAESPDAIERSVVHHIPGRVRFRVPALCEEPAFGDRAVAYLTRQRGVLTAHATAACASLVVNYDADQVCVEQIDAWLSSAIPPARAAHRVRVADRPSIASLVCGGAALGLSLLGGSPALATGLLAVSALPIFARAIKSLVADRHVSVDTLDATAVGVLAARGDIFAAGLTATLVAGGEYIRELTARRSRGALVGLLAATGQYAWVVRGIRHERLPVEALTAGDTVVVYPGDTVLVDGVVIHGHALVDQKVLTGESTPVLKQPGDAVYAATLLTDGKLFVRAEQTGAGTRACRIVQIVEGAPTHDTRIANYAGKFADRLVLPTLGLAGVVYLATRSVTRAASIVIFDFATGIRVSAPTTVLAAMTAAARRDVLVKSGRALEQLARMDTIVFDKTGTLTAGTPKITEVRTLAVGYSPDRVLSLAAAAERRLKHPAAAAIVQAAEAQGLDIPDHGETHYTVGQGIWAEVLGQTVLVGAARYLAAHGVDVPPGPHAAADAAGERGASTVFVAYGGELIGFLCYADVTRPEAGAALAALRARGIKRMVMVTGDNAHVARLVAAELGIHEVAAEVFPERKAEIVRELREAGHVVGVIGDGINDSPALAYADVSVSLKAATDVARETADVVLHGDLRGMVEAVDVGRESVRLIRQNLAIVAVPNGAGLALATAGLVGPIAATVVNNGTNLVAALNGLRPLLSRPSRRAR